MTWRVVVSLLLAAGASAVPAKPKPRNWQTGEVTRVQRPGDARQSAWGTLGYNVPGSTQVVVPQPSSFLADWAIAVALPDAVYVVTAPSPPRSGSLARIKAGSKLECAVEGKTMFLKDEKGAVFRARIGARLARPAEPKD